jgi:hypothetical protein
MGTAARPTIDLSAKLMTAPKNNRMRTTQRI